MKSTKTAITAALAAAGLITSISAWSIPLPVEKTQGSVAYLSGGVGTVEARAIQKLARKYPLELEFLLKTGAKKGAREEYTADIPVTIRDLHGNVVLDVRSDGPFLLVKLPAGRYLASAEHNGKIERRHFEVTAKHQRVVFEWRA